MADDAPTEPAWITELVATDAEALREALALSAAVDSDLSFHRHEYYGPTRSCAPGALVFFHGTSWANAQSIRADGFIPSQAGCLGPGIYVGRCDKALRFARDASGGRLVLLTAHCVLRALLTTLAYGVLRLYLITNEQHSARCPRCSVCRCLLGT